jgi:hypothetical protein
MQKQCISRRNVNVYRNGAQQAGRGHAVVTPSKANVWSEQVAAGTAVGVIDAVE